MLPSTLQISIYTWRSFSPRLLTLAVVILLVFALEVTAVGEVVWAVNCGGDAHVDVFGVHYQRDWLNVGHASSHGRSIVIRRVPQSDQILYQTERYHTTNFAYDLPIKNDGEYVLVMKFSEVWFTRPNQKVVVVCCSKTRSGIFTQSADVGKVYRHFGPKTLQTEDTSACPKCPDTSAPVSYTHLTLPTILRV